jgi:hypothetical protein
MMDRAIARVGKFQDEEFVETRLTQVVRGAAFRTVAHTYPSIPLSKASLSII